MLVIYIVSMFSIPLSTSNSLVSTYKEEALQFSNTLFQKITFFWNILKYYIRERWDWSPWLERARFLVGGSDTHPGVSILAMIIVTWYLLRERKQRLSIRESAVSLFKLLSSPY